MRYFISVSGCYEYAKEYNFVIIETTCCNRSCRMVKNFKGCTIQSTIRDFTHSDSDKQVEEINDSKEQVDARNWLRNDSSEQVDQINESDKQVYAIKNDSNKQVDAISDSKRMVVTGSNPKSDPISNPKVAPHTTNGNFAQKLLISRFVSNIIPVVIQPIKLPSPPMWWAYKTFWAGARRRSQSKFRL